MCCSVQVNQPASLASLGLSSCNEAHMKFVKEAVDMGFPQDSPEFASIVHMVMESANVLIPLVSDLERSCTQMMSWA